MINDFSHTRCFIDADGTLFNSLAYYNVVIDEMFIGKYTDRRYIDYQSDFDQKCCIIPGSPWKKILRELVDYLTGNIPDEETVEQITAEFTDKSVVMFQNMDRDKLIIDPVIRFCEEYKENGGEMIIHSGTNHRILLAMLETAGIRDLFIDYLCSDMMVSDSLDLGKWGYKTELLRRLRDKYPDNGRHGFVVGDTKGDGFGAYESGLPFLLVWRGYPKYPYALKTEDGNFHIEPELAVDMRQKEVETRDKSIDDAYVAEMIDWCRNPGIKVPKEKQRLFQEIN